VGPVAANREVYRLLKDGVLVSVPDRERGGQSRAPPHYQQKCPPQSALGTDADDPERSHGRPERQQGAARRCGAAGFHPADHNLGGFFGNRRPHPLWISTPAGHDRGFRLSLAFADSPSIAIPQSPDRLIAMQENKPEKDRPKKPERSAPEKVKQVLELINSLDTNAYEDQQIALTLVRNLEQFHDKVVDEMQDDEEASHSQIVGWAIDADRLMRCRMLLESVDLD
jgi:hypothetical protein